MKQFTTFAIMALALISCTKIEGEGAITTRNSTVSNLTGSISISDAIKLTLSDELEPGELSITTHDNIHQYIEIINTHEELEIELKGGRNYKNVNIEVVASSKQYNDIEASGASRVMIDGEAAVFDEYDIELSGASKFNGEINASKKLDVSLSGASEANISGNTLLCEAYLEGASKLYDTSFTCDVLDVELSGGSIVKMSVTQSIIGELSGASRVEYKGSPAVSVKTSGNSTTKQI